ncbi:hypothetical protein KXR77_20920 [Xanthomonas euvesicatoria]|uniref:ParC family partition-associated protein n=1 Tax=Xanthomonas euvesicatoria TaxID=456327 RepID=UPI001C443362|nr:ParC family partition-associated protein [Xanthomonas euvesicatoria]MBV6885930.1 hypothetical protein [Xanthomonas campestris pv. euphorbiae]
MIEPEEFADLESATVVDHRVYRELAAAGSVQGACVRSAGEDKGLVILLRVGNQNRVLGRRAGGPRYFQSFDSAAHVLDQAGIVDWVATSRGWTPKTAVKYRHDKEARAAEE